MIYITSDLHFCHDRGFIYGPRGFKSVHEMNEALVKNWNELITPDDDVYVLGDLVLKDIHEGIRYWDQLVGRKHVILGNHDTGERPELYKQCHDTVVEGYAMPLRYKHYEFFLSHYPTVTDHYKEGESLHNLVIDLCGHTHTDDKFADFEKGLIYHVELDAHDNRPVRIDQIIEDIKDRLGIDR